MTYFEPTVDVIILAGGRSSRMGGKDKAQLRIGGARFIDHVINGLRAYCGIATIVVVTPHVYPLPHDILRTCERPMFGGPVAGIAAGANILRTSPARRVFVIAVDAPASTKLLPRLLHALTTADVAAVSNQDGFLEPLCALWDKAALFEALRTLPDAANTPAKHLIQAAGTVTTVPGTGDEQDYDTPESLKLWHKLSN